MMQDKCFLNSLNQLTKKEGILLILNGMDGAGKGVQFEQLYKIIPNAKRLREPGGTVEAEKIRQVILSVELTLHDRLEILKGLLNDDAVVELCKNYLSQANIEMRMNGLTGTAEKFLFAASRAQTNLTLVKPFVEKGEIVLGERSVACSMAYQGHARGLGMDEVWNINKKAIESSFPNLEIFLDVTPEIAQKRLKGRTNKQDRLDKESYEFHKKTRDGYMNFYERYCPYPYQIIDASGTVEETFKKIKNTILTRIKAD